MKLKVVNKGGCDQIVYLELTGDQKKLAENSEIEIEPDQDSELTIELTTDGIKIWGGVASTFID